MSSSVGHKEKQTRSSFDVPKTSSFRAGFSKASKLSGLISSVSQEQSDFKSINFIIILSFVVLKTC